MRMNVAIQTGELRGKTIVVEEGQTVSIGRTEKADFPLPQDTFLSRVHFALECGAGGCRVVDRKSANGTYLNGQKVSAAEVKDGDVILAGQTEFLLRITAVPAEEPAMPAAVSITELPPKEAISPAAEGLNLAQQAAAVRMESWSFGVIPEGWRVVEGFGLRRDERNAFPSEAMVNEETIPREQTLSQYAESQMDVLRLFVSQPQIDPLGSPRLTGAEETKAFLVRYKADDGRRFVQRQIFVRSGQAAGSLALTTLESEAPAVQPFFDQILHGVIFNPKNN